MKLARELRLLTSGAYPAAHADVVDDIARDPFTDALDNVTIEKVLDADPANLEAAQRKALLVEANMKKNATARAAAAAFSFRSSKPHCCMLVMLSALASP